MRSQFGKTICDLAEKDPRVVLIYGDVFQDMQEFQERFPDRVFNLGLCEQSIVSIAGGLASMGMRPIVYSITPFLLERAFEQIKVDIDTNKLPVIFVGYSDYPTHGITHTCINQNDMVDLFRNVRAYFPTNKAQTAIFIKSAYVRKSPSFIFLKKSNETQQV